MALTLLGVIVHSLRWFPRAYRSDREPATAVTDAVETQQRGESDAAVASVSVCEKREQKYGRRKPNVVECRPALAGLVSVLTGLWNLSPAVMRSNLFLIVQQR